MAQLIVPIHVRDNALLDDRIKGILRAILVADAQGTTVDA